MAGERERAVLEIANKIERQVALLLKCGFDKKALVIFELSRPIDGPPEYFIGLKFYEQRSG